MSISEWSDSIVVAELQDEPALSDDLTGLIDRVRDLESAPNVVLNFVGVTYLNSSNLAQLLDLRRSLNDSEATLRICGLRESVWNLFVVTGLDKVFEIQENTAMALASLQIDDEDGEPSEEI